LAQLVSIIDRDRNLDLLLDTNSEESLKKLWLDIFGDVNLLNVPYTRLDNKYVFIWFQDGFCKPLGPKHTNASDMLDFILLHNVSYCSSQCKPNMHCIRCSAR